MQAAAQRARCAARLPASFIADHDRSITAVIAMFAAVAHPWPDAFDRTMIAAYVLAAFGLPALGYVLDGA